MKRIYLDHHSLHPPLPEVIEGMREVCIRGYASPSGFHSEAKSARSAIDQARDQVLNLLGADPAEFEVIFTGNPVEAAHLGIFGFVKSDSSFPNSSPECIITSPIEVPAFRDSIDELSRQDFSVKKIEVDEKGHYETESASEVIDEKATLICLQKANPELGTIQNLAPIADLMRKHSAAFLVDLSSAIGRTPIHFDHLNPDLALISPSEFGGPVGIGLLVKRRRIELQHSYFQNMMEGSLLPGDENIPAIVGVGIAAELAISQMHNWKRHLQNRQNQLWFEIKNKVSDCHLNGPPIGSDRLCHQLSLSIEGVESEGLVLFSDMRGLAISTAGGCLHRGNERYDVLEEIGLSKLQARQTITLSVGNETTEKDIEVASEILSEGVRRIRSFHL